MEVQIGQMKIWLFTFTQEDRECLSIRVAAPTRQSACSLLGEKLHRYLDPTPFKHPEPGTILQGFGKIDVPKPAIIGFTDLDGKYQEAPQ